MALKVDTSKVKSAAQNISRKNQNISDDLENVRRALGQLDRVWDGAGSTAAIRNFNSINAYEKTRFGIVNDLVRFMNEQAGERYEQMEQNISSAASAFK